jgi:hypothetical protein
MSLFLPKRPAVTEKVVADALKRAHATGRFSFSGIPGAGATVIPTAPHQVFALGLSSLAEHRGAGAAGLVGWRVLVFLGKRPVAIVEFKGKTSEGTDLNAVHQGHSVQATATAILAAERLAQVQTADYEVRLIGVHALRLLALWLHGEKDELFVPLAPAPRGFKAYDLYTEERFLAEARALAARRHPARR